MLKKHCLLSFVDEWGPAIDNENAGFAEYKCFHPMPLPAQAKILPGIRIFTRKGDGSPKARFCMGGHSKPLSFWARITFQIRTTVQSFLVVIIESFLL